MFEYRLLTQRQQAEIAHRKLLELEAEHARLELDIRLSKATGIENDSVATAEEHLVVLVQQMATLTSWLTPPPVEDEVPVSENGHRPVPAE